MAAGTACYRIPLVLVSLCLLWVRELSLSTNKVCLVITRWSDNENLKCFLLLKLESPGPSDLGL